MEALPHDHGENLNYVLKDLPDQDNFSAVSTLFGCLSDNNRIKLFWFLCHFEECVINLSALMHMSSPALSHHLRLLRENCRIVSRRSGNHMIELLIDITCPKVEKQKENKDDDLD